VGEELHPQQCVRVHVERQVLTGATAQHSGVPLTHTHTYTHTLTHTRTHVYTHTHTYTHAYTHTRAHTYTQTKPRSTRTSVTTPAPAPLVPVAAPVTVTPATPPLPLPLLQLEKLLLGEGGPTARGWNGEVEGRRANGQLGLPPRKGSVHTSGTHTTPRGRHTTQHSNTKRPKQMGYALHLTQHTRARGRSQGRERGGEGGGGGNCLQMARRPSVHTHPHGGGSGNGPHR
jgi:hypothetical protein